MNDIVEKQPFIKTVRLILPVNAEPLPDRLAWETYTIMYRIHTHTHGLAVGGFNVRGHEWCVYDMDWPAESVWCSQFLSAQHSPRLPLRVMTALPGILLEGVESQAWLIFSPWPFNIFSTNIWGSGGLNKRLKASKNSWLFYFFTYLIVSYFSVLDAHCQAQVLLPSTPFSTKSAFEVIRPLRTTVQAHW